MIPWAVVIASWVLIVATLLPLVRHEAWWIRVFDFPRSQILVCQLGAAAALWLIPHSNFLFQAGTLTILVLCISYQGWEMSAYTPLRRKQSLAAESEDPSRRIRLLVANVLMSNREADAYRKLVGRYEPDIIVLAEPDAWWEEQMRPIEDAYSYSIKCALPNTYGLLLYSRLPLTDPQVLFRVEDDVPSFRAMVKLECGDSIELHAIHPRPPHIGVDTENRDGELVLVAKEVRNRPHAVIVTGDLNDVAWSHTTRLFLRISGLLDPRIGRMLCNTFHAGQPLFRWPLDHLFHSRSFRLVRMERAPRSGSDHFAVFIELSYEPEELHEQERPVADHEDHQEAEEKLDKLNDN